MFATGEVQKDVNLIDLVKSFPTMDSCAIFKVSSLNMCFLYATFLHSYVHFSISDVLFSPMSPFLNLFFKLDPKVQRIFGCENRRRQSRERASQGFSEFSSYQISFSPTRPAPPGIIRRRNLKLRTSRRVFVGRRTFFSVPIQYRDL